MQTNDNAIGQWLAWKPYGTEPTAVGLVVEVYPNGRLVVLRPDNGKRQTLAPSERL